MNERFGVRQPCCRFSHQPARLYIWRSAIMRALFCGNGTVKHVAHFLNERARRKGLLQKR